MLVVFDKHVLNFPMRSAPFQHAGIPALHGRRHRRAFHILLITSGARMMATKHPAHVFRERGNDCRLRSPYQSETKRSYVASFCPVRLANACGGSYSLIVQSIPLALVARRCRIESVRSATTSLARPKDNSDDDASHRDAPTGPERPRCGDA